jgi:hypothetical protein
VISSLRGNTGGYLSFKVHSFPCHTIYDQKAKEPWSKGPRLDPRSWQLIFFFFFFFFF